jgi:hypothetical protein
MGFYTPIFEGLFHPGLEVVQNRTTAFVGVGEALLGSSPFALQEALCLATSVIASFNFVYSWGKKVFIQVDTHEVAPELR